MTREEAIKVLNSLYNVQRLDTLTQDEMTAVAIAIKALERGAVLDKIRAEIADLDNVEFEFEGYYKAVADAVKIIDKYKEEGEKEA